MSNVRWVLSAVWENSDRERPSDETHYVKLVPYELFEESVKKYSESVDKFADLSEKHCEAMEEISRLKFGSNLQDKSIN